MWILSICNRTQTICGKESLTQILILGSIGIDSIRKLKKRPTFSLGRTLFLSSQHHRDQRQDGEPTLCQDNLLVTRDTAI